MGHLLVVMRTRVWQRKRSLQEVWCQVGSADGTSIRMDGGGRGEAAEPGANPQGFRRTGNSRDDSNSWGGVTGLHELQGSWEFKKKKSRGNVLETARHSLHF